MMTLRSIFFVLGASILAAGCDGTVHTSAYVSSPDLVEVGPDVEVVADYDYPVFYSGAYYWRYDGGVWYRSHVHDGGWVRASNVPVAVLHVDRPASYAHYRAVDHRTPAPRASSVPGSRDHRTPEPRANRVPSSRDHRH